ncbi:lycopene cyclase domain-containing protein [Luteibaculum oceani]|uniref:lycopene cyclase domain-containing protein n=1 Tax=Luteibaculum oceani TaxID=1294296 RepID=UPI001CB958A0|nr:lycopene cyclase domain-containing protein [Luteibaculum oceani]
MRSKKWNGTGLVLGIVCLAIGVLTWDRIYSGTAFTSAGLFLLVQYAYRWDGFPRFLLSYGLCLLPFYLVNGLLTGAFIQEQVVWYNDFENLGIRVFTIPLDDHFYSLSLQGFIVFLFDRNSGKQQ